MHPLLRQHLNHLGLDEQTAPADPAGWQTLLTLLDQTYQENEATLEQWKHSFDQLREEMEGSFESLRRSSASIILGEHNKLQSVITALGEGLCALNTNGCLLFMNQEAERLLGWEEAELRGQLVLDWIMPSTENDSTTAKLWQFIQAGQPYDNQDAVFVQRQGRPIPVSFYLDPMMQDGGFLGAVLVFRNITAQKRAEAERERKLQEILLLNRVIATATSSLDLRAVLHTICQELAHFFNLPQAAFALLNDKKDHLTIVAEYLEEGRIPALGTVIPVDNNLATQEVLRTHKPIVIEDAQNDPRQAALHDIARRRGTRSVLIIPLLVRGEVLGTLGLNATEYRVFTQAEIELVQNIASAASQSLANAQLYEAVQQELAERRRAEAELAQARDKALEASRLKSELVAKVSHELRTPLTSIMGFAEMLQLGIYGAVSDEQIATLEKIMQSTDHLVVVVNDLLDLSQFEAGKLRLRPGPFYPQTLLERLTNNLRLVAERRGLRLLTKLDPQLPEVLHGDVDRLHQILTNLVNNAIKFTEEGQIEVDLYRFDPDHWCIQVQDSGPGIPKEMHEYIFDEFRQVEFTTTRKHKGVGLGLSIVKQIVKGMRGQIELESELGQGSTFRVILPFQPEKAGSSE